MERISIHSLRVEGDQVERADQLYRAPFQSTPSVWRETTVQSAERNIITISIHSLRVEGDCRCGCRGTWRGNFNPLPPCGGRLLNECCSGCHVLFQSTPSVWRETALPACCSRRQSYFNPLPPCGGRRQRCFAGSSVPGFQSTPSVWRETDKHRNRVRPRLFQSTPSVWRETRCGARREWIEVFQSTPSVWRETALPACCSRRQSYFNPLPPCGGRRTSAGGVQGWSGISIHSLRVEGDHAAGFCGYCIFYFNPLPPCGGRPAGGDTAQTAFFISIHSLRVEGD